MFVILLSKLVRTLHPIDKIHLKLLTLSQHECPSPNKQFQVFTNAAKSYFKTEVNPTVIYDCRLSRMTVQFFAPLLRPFRNVKIYQNMSRRRIRSST